LIKYEGYTLNISKKNRFARQNGSLRGEMQAMAEYNLLSSLSGYAVTIKKKFTAER
jgi:hypothetical protein